MSTLLLFKIWAFLDHIEFLLITCKPGSVEERWHNFNNLSCCLFKDESSVVCVRQNENNMSITCFWCVSPLITRSSEGHAARLSSPRRARCRYPTATVSWGECGGTKEENKSERPCRVMWEVTISHQNLGFCRMFAPVKRIWDSPLVRD